MRKKALSLLLAVTTVVSGLSLTGCGSSSDDAHTFTIWKAQGVASSYYTDFAENPVINYITKTKEFEGEDGEKSKINLKFQIPTSGSEADSFNAMLSTGTYPEVMEMTYCSSSVEELYKNGTVLDLTDYVNKYMPNYKKYIEEHPDLATNYTTNIDGEEKYIQLASSYDELSMMDQFCGYCYRRDWIVKYGKQPDQLWTYDKKKNKKVYKDNPNAGKSFSGYYSKDKDGNDIHETELKDNVDGDSWVDDVVFPSGNSDPTYISDWEWMLQILKTAIDDQKITDGYTMSLWYPGVVANGELVSSFGGGGPFYYIDQETGKAACGLDGEGFKTYMQVMNKWYKDGYIDQNFDEKSSNSFYQVDETLVYQGKVGLWLGIASNLGTRIVNEEQTNTKGAVVYASALPINDEYGSDNVKWKEPYCMYQGGLVGQGFCITDKAKEKDIVQFLKFFDYMFSEEGSLLNTMGLSKEQYEEVEDPIYKKFGLTEGAYTKNDDGTYKFCDILKQNDNDIQGAMTLNGYIGLKCNSKIDWGYPETYQHSRELWLKYKATGFFGSTYNSRISTDDQKTVNQYSSKLSSEYVYVEVPKFIKGTNNFDSDYESFVQGCKKRGMDKITKIYQNAIEAVEEAKQRLGVSTEAETTASE